MWRKAGRGRREEQAEKLGVEFVFDLFLCTIYFYVVPMRSNPREYEIFTTTANRPEKGHFLDPPKTPHF